jgi:hypothetical protein
MPLSRQQGIQPHLITGLLVFQNQFDSSSSSLTTSSCFSITNPSKINHNNNNQSLVHNKTQKFMAQTQKFITNPKITQQHNITRKKWCFHKQKPNESRTQKYEAKCLNSDFESKKPNEPIFSKLGFEIGDFRRRSGFVEIEGLKKERLNHLPR